MQQFFFADWAQQTVVIKVQDINFNKFTISFAYCNSQIPELSVHMLAFYSGCQCCEVQTLSRRRLTFHTSFQLYPSCSTNTRWSIDGPPVGAKLWQISYTKLIRPVPDTILLIFSWYQDHIIFRLYKTITTTLQYVQQFR